MGGAAMRPYGKKRILSYVCPCCFAKDTGRRASEKRDAEQEIADGADEFAQDRMDGWTIARPPSYCECGDDQC